MELISVIIPVYKVERYLRECLDSVLANTYKNLEILLVDDGSPDACPQICDEYAQKDSRVYVIHQKNQGISVARNVGLSAATGTYVAFVDSDDVVSPFLYETLVRAIEVEQADIASCEYTRKSLDENRCPISFNKVYRAESFEQQLSVITCAPHIRPTTWTGAFVWNKLYRRILIQEPFSSQLYHAEDLLFNYHYIKNSSSMVVVPLALYLYRSNEQGITELYQKNAEDTTMTIRRGKSLVAVWTTIASTSDLSNSLNKYLAAQAAHCSHGVLRRMYAANVQDDYLDLVQVAKNTFRRGFRWMLTSPDYSLIEKAAHLLCRYAFPLWCILAKKIQR